MITKINPLISFKSSVGIDLNNFLGAVKASYDPENQFPTKKQAFSIEEQNNKRFLVATALEEATDNFIKHNKIAKGDELDKYVKDSLIKTLPELIGLEEDSQLKDILKSILDRISGK